MALEQFRNSGSSTLSGNITAGQTSFGVVNGAVYPQTGAFRTRIGTELMWVGAVSGNTLSSVLRGIEFTKAIPHVTGEAVQQGITAGSIRSFGFLGRPSLVAIPPVWESFVGVNTAGVTFYKDEAGLTMDAPVKGSGFNLIGQYQVAPAPPYSVTASFDFNLFYKSLLGYGMGWMSSGGAFATFDNIAIVNETQELSVRKANNSTTYNSGYLFLKTMGWVRWMRLRDDGTNRKCFISADGSAWLEVHSIARTDFLTPTQIGWHLWNENLSAPNTGCQLRLLSWDVTLG